MHNLNAVNFSKGTNVGNLSLPSARCLHRSHYALRSLDCARSWDMKTKQDRDTSSVTRTLSPVQTDATLLANNSQRWWMLHVAFECKQCWMLLYVAVCCWELFRKVWNRSNSWANNCPSQYFFCSMIADVGTMLDQCWINVGSIFTPLPTLLLLATHAHYTRIHPISRPSHDALQVATLLGVIASLCTPLLQRTQQLPTLLAQQFWKLLCPFASSFKKFHNNLCMQFTRNLWVTYDACIWVEIGQIQVICFFCLNMQHLRAVTGFAHRSLGSTFQQSVNQREIVLKLIARKSIQITLEILQWFVMIHFELISTVNKIIDRGKQ